MSRFDPNDIHLSMRRLYQAAAAKAGQVVRPGEIADLLDVTPGVISNWCRRGMLLRAMRKAQAVLECDVDWPRNGEEGLLAQCSTGRPLSGSSRFLMP